MRVLSGIQPTGELHIGNYLGAIKQWVKLQQKYECIFFVADLHAMTVPFDPKMLSLASRQKIIELIATGLDPERCILFIQSHIKEHAELAWLLGTITPIGELERMTQYKEKARKFTQNINAGLFTYPVLQAADILLYQTDLVPVGKDQQQHIELTRTIARKFNTKFGKTFKEPKALMIETGAKIMSLTDPKKKMSKTDRPESYLSVFDSPEAIRKKIMAAVTDTGKEILYNQAKKPGISNLLLIYSAFSDTPIKDLEKKFKGIGYADFKKQLGELLVEKLEPFRRKRAELESRNAYIEEILSKGAKRAQQFASFTMEDVRKKMGLVS
jgi:tryptophanyl-tRNA synthetase